MVGPSELAKLIVSPAPIDLTSGESVDLSVKGEDAYGNEVSVKPDFLVQPSELGTISAKGVLSAGKAGIGSLVASVSTIRVSTPVRVNVGPLVNLKIELPQGKILAGKTYRLKAVGYDAGGNQIPVEPVWAATPSIGDIDQTTGVFHAIKSGHGLVTAYSGKIETVRAIAVGPGEAYSLFIEPNPVTVKSGHIQKFKVTGFDVKGNKVNVSEAAMNWNLLGGIGVFEAPGTFRGTTMGKGKVTVGIGSLLAESYVTVVPGTPDMSNSRVWLTYPLLPADGKSFSEVVVDVRDRYNNPVPDVQVTLVSNRQNDKIAQPPKTNQEGAARGKVSSNESGTAVISAVVKGRTFLDTATVTFK
jgi:hypothetical protein